MIALKPYSYSEFSCPECSSKHRHVKDILVFGMTVVADTVCERCGSDFYRVLPAGHTAAGQNIAISRKDNCFYADGTTPWLKKLLLDSIVLKDKEVHIRKRVFKACKRVVILNTLDFLYGHVLLKLYNAQHHLDHDQDLGLVVILPAMYEWLIPQGCAEAWIVDLKLGELAYGYRSIQQFVSAELTRFDEAYLSRAYSHPDHATLDIARFTGVVPFNIDRFTQEKPCVTFILREDRWWHENITGYWFYRLCRKLKILKWGGRVLAAQQNRLVKRTIRRIRGVMPNVDFYVAGLGDTGNFKGYAVDTRATKIDADIEKSWCNLYARSHVVVGVHGSNMLLPTALAAGCVEILPEDRYGNIVQDIAVRYTDRRQLFLYRFADQYASPSSVAAKVAAILQHYGHYYQNMCKDVYSPEEAYTR